MPLILFRLCIDLFNKLTIWLRVLCNSQSNNIIVMNCKCFFLKFVKYNLFLLISFTQLYTCWWSNMPMLTYIRQLGIHWLISGGGISQVRLYKLIWSYTVHIWHVTNLACSGQSVTVNWNSIFSSQCGFDLSENDKQKPLSRC